MTMQQTLGVVGFVVGAYFGYPQLGLVVGSLIGTALTPKTKTEGPRLDDLKVTVSTYGVGIPILFGTERLGGNVIRSSDKFQIGFTEEVGGKGGGAENTTYRTFVHMRVSLCETPRDGSQIHILKLLQDGKLIWDSGAGISVGSALASAENPNTQFTLYQGWGDQLPDPFEEAYMGGAGSISADRGVVSASMRNVECPGGRIPSFSFVLSNGSTVGLQISQQIESTPNAANSGALIRSDGVWEWETNQIGSVFEMPYEFGQIGSLTPMGQTSFPTGGYTPYPVAGDGPPMAIKPYTSGELYLINFQEKTLNLIYDGGSSGQGIFFGRAAYDPTVDLYVINSWDTGTTGNDPIIVNAAGSAIVCDAVAGDGHGGCVAFHGGVVHILTTDGTNPIYSRRNQDGEALAEWPDTIGPADAFSPRWSAIYVSDQGVYFYAVSGSTTGVIYKITPATLSSPGAFTVLASDTGMTPATIFGTASISFYCTDSTATIGPIYGGEPSAAGYNLVRFNAVTPADAQVKDIIASLCERAGETRYDVSAIPDSDTVHGYKLANPASARANIDPLLTVFGIFIVDEDGLIKFKKYEDIESVTDVDYVELGQSQDLSESSDSMPLMRRQEIDLPRSVTGNYIEAQFDYQTASETVLRQVTDATEDQTIEFPIAINSDQARTATERLLYSAWRQQNTRSFKTSRKFSWLSPGDGVTVEYPRGTYKLWRIMSMNDDGLVLEFNVEPGDAEIYTQSAVGSGDYTQQEVAPLPPPTRLQLLDIPILRDQDNNAGIYAALDNIGPGWNGAELRVGYSDTESGLSLVGTVSTDAPIGFAKTVLAAGPVGLVDETNIFTVNIGDNEFSNVTRDVLLENGGEFWAYGEPGRWEIGSSALGDDLGGGDYILSRHLRGLFGTEAHVGTHQSGDTFVLLRIAGMLRPLMGVGDIGQSQFYRAISKGRSFNSAASISYTNTGEGLMPLSPVNLRRSDTNDLSVDRRSRLSMNNSTGTLPLGEATEAYSWSFYDATFTTLIGTAITTTATITAAQITAAGVTPSATMYVQVRQISDTVGLGHELQATV